MLTYRCCATTCSGVSWFAAAVVGCGVSWGLSGGLFSGAAAGFMVVEIKVVFVGYGWFSRLDLMVLVGG